MSLDTATESETPSEEASRIVLGLLRGYWQLGALRALHEIGGLAQLAASGPLSAAELAGLCKVDASMLTRVLRNVASIGLLRTVSPGTYELTEAGRATLASPQLAGHLAFNGHPNVWERIGELPQALRDGVPPFRARHPGSYDWMKDNPAVATAFQGLMTASFTPVAEALARAVDFSAMKTVVDVGGGNGQLLAAILKVHPGPRGVLAELGYALAGARAHLDSEGVGDRCDVMDCNFFTEPLPAGADAYLVARIMHNYKDPQAEAVLRAIRAAAPDRGKVMIVEAVLPDGDEPCWAKDLDVRMMAGGAGGERTEAEYAGLLERSGFVLESATDICDGQYVVVGAAA